ncbi:hypothetical protein FKN01_30710 [Streptomyces sp. 130]|uniref:ABC transporter ATP-binding protein n=1 Tax=Streptomyces sp. 130 TaxID=2591006 RepID=UPI00117C3C5E|nr:ABC transporter ATP-binding protein [Streptomyces sp. 130]TRV72003.1 hypothetical protein FKN01_30710 [Streptomyces sp. 130]
MGRDFGEEMNQDGEEIVVLEGAVHGKTIDSPSVICDVNLVVRKGIFLAVMGPRESGRTTLLRSLAGQVQLTSGFLWRAPEAHDAVLCGGEFDERALDGPPRLLLVDDAGPAQCTLLRAAVDDGRAVAAVATTDDVTGAAAADAVLFMRRGRVVDMVAGSNPARVRQCLRRVGGEPET